MTNRHPAEATETLDAPDSFGLRVLISSLDPFQRFEPIPLGDCKRLWLTRGPGRKHDFDLTCAGVAPTWSFAEVSEQDVADMLEAEAEEARDRARELAENEYEHRARWGLD